MKQGYFGPPQLRKDFEEQVDVPVGTPCLYCAEQFAAGDIGTVEAAGAFHYECRLRMVIGSVAHQQRRCVCFGGDDHDLPDGMTVREEAIAAARLWERNR